MPSSLRRFLPSYPSLVSSALGVSAAIVLGSSSIALAQAPAADDAARQAFYKEKIQPILSAHCYDCHSADGGSAGGLRVDDRAALLKGGRSGPAIVPGKPDESLLVQRVTTSDVKQRMPKSDDPLTADQISQLKSWIADGAAWSAPDASASSSSAPAEVPSTVAPAAASAATASPAAQAKDGKASLTRVPYPRPATAAQLAFFEKKVRPILVNRCYNCHSAAFKEAGGLRVDVGISIFTGGKDGAVIIPGHPEESLLIRRVKSTDPKKRMPQESNESLPADEIATLEAWIKDGAAWPDETEKLPPTPERLRRVYPQLRAEWWSWQPLTRPAAPVLANDTWSSGDIDRFVLANLQAKKLAPVADADPVVLLRRLRYDL
ncbi:c-type cytochrome domain-containing protein, partial [Silvibacterium sp.]|uniref:c-type cytochrome domain-containing protein n=1 Tax=Silvibacterium sp. TaxID=1964179 RepID=UPI0039E6025D